MGWFGDGWTVAERTGDPQGMSWYIDGGRMTHLGVEEEDEMRREGWGGEKPAGKKVDAESNVEMDGVARSAGTTSGL